MMVAVHAAKSSIDVKVTKEFQLSVSSVTADKGKIEIDGECFLYDRATPTYTLIIGGSEASTTVEAKKFRATVEMKKQKSRFALRVTQPCQQGYGSSHLRLALQLKMLPGRYQ